MTVTVPSTTTLQELNELQGAMSSSLVTVNATVKALKALADARTLRKSQLAKLEAQLAASKKQNGLGGLRAKKKARVRPPARSASLGDGAFATGQLEKVQSWADQGYYSTMLEAAVRIAEGVLPTDDPVSVLKDPAKFQAVNDVVEQAMQGDSALGRTRQALLSMRAGVMGQPNVPIAFNQDEYDAAVAGDLAYIQSHAPGSGFVEKALRQTAGVVGTLDTYVPGWSLLLDVATPVLPIAPLLQTIVGAVPLVGGLAKTITDAAPLIGTQTSAAPLSPLTQSFGPEVVTGGLGPAQTTAPYLAQEPLQTVTGRLGAVRFELTKSTAQAAMQGEGVLDTLEQTGQDLLDGYALAASLVAIFASGGALAPEFGALNAAITALKTAVSLVKTYQAAEALKAAADKAKAQAAAEAKTDASLLAQLEQELAALQSRLAATERASVPSSSSGLKKVAAVLAAAWFISEVWG